MRRLIAVSVVLLLLLGASACVVDSDEGESAAAVTTDIPSTAQASTTTTTATPATTTTTTTPPLTIMPIGDSITSGETGWATYRCYLDGMLTDAGVSFDFVGRLSEPKRGDSYGCPNVFDQDHEGWWDTRIDWAIRDVTGSVDDLQPDVALIHYGTNDIYRDEGPEHTAEQLGSFVTDLQAVSPDITVLVAQIMPMNLPLVARITDDTLAFNEAIASLGDLSTDESLVIVVDMYTGFSLDYFRDPWHPNDAGDEFIAGRWMEALQEAGVIGTTTTAATTNPVAPDYENAHTATFDGTECVAVGPTELGAGEYSFTLVNLSEKDLDLFVIRFARGKTLQDAYDDQIQEVGLGLAGQGLR